MYPFPFFSLHICTKTYKYQATELTTDPRTRTGPYTLRLCERLQIWWRESESGRWKRTCRKRTE
jgi:hypothetical protein